MVLLASAFVKTVTLANQTRTTLVLNLPHDVVPELATRGVVGTRDHNGKTGDRTVRAHRKRISGSVTLLPKGIEGDMVRGLPFSVMKSPDVQRALNAWPPKLAAKILEKDEREKEEKALAEQAEKDATAKALAKTMADKRAAKLAKAAGAPAASVPTPNGNGNGNGNGPKAAGRVARPAGKE